MNIIDRVLFELSPGKAAKRMQNKALALAHETQKRSYEGAAKGRRFDSFRGNKASVNSEIGKEKDTLTQRSRYLYKNSHHFRRAVKVIANNVVGYGIIPSFNTKNTSWKEKMKIEWRNWAENIKCDYDGNFDFYGLQKLAMRTVSIAGECIIVRRDVTIEENPLGLQLQVLAPEFLDNTKNQDNTGGGGYIMNGVEYNSNGKRIKYWLYDRNPLESATAISKPIDVSFIIHLYDADEPGQHRGVPSSTPVMLKIKDLEDYSDSELVGKKVSACYGTFITKNDPSSGDDADPDDYDTDIEHVEPGMVYRLFPGEGVSHSAPPISNGYESFVKTHRQDVATGLGVTYEQLTGDYSNVNFSSYKAGWNEFGNNIDDLRWMLIIPKFCNPVFAWLLVKIKVAGMQVPEDFILSWTPPRKKMVDPKKEIEGDKLAVRAGFNTWSNVVRENGLEPDQVISEYKSDVELFREAGIKAEWNSEFDPKQQEQTIDNKKEDEE